MRRGSNLFNLNISTLFYYFNLVSVIMHGRRISGYPGKITGLACSIIMSTGHCLVGKFFYVLFVLILENGQLIELAGCHFCCQTWIKEVSFISKLEFIIGLIRMA